MKIHVACECGRKLAVDEALLGKKVRCPGCRLVFVASAPDPAPPETFAVLPEELAPAPKPVPARRRREEDEDEPEEPRRRRQRQEDSDDAPLRRKRPVETGGGFWTTDSGLDGFLVTASVLALVVGGVGLWYGIQQLRLAATASDTPQTLPLSQLIAKGPGDNAHVIVTDFVPATNYAFSYQKGKYESVSKDQAERRNWNSVYIPLVPLTPDLKARLMNRQDVRAELHPRAVRVVVIPKNANNKATTENWCSNTTRVQGMVVNLIRSLDSQTEKLLKESYPETDFSRCWIIKEGETPARAGAQLAIITASTLGVGMAVFYLLVRTIKRMQAR